MYVCILMYICMYVWLNVFKSSMYVFIYMYVCTYICICILLSVCLCMFLCMYAERKNMCYLFVQGRWIVVSDRVCLYNGCRLQPYPTSVRNRRPHSKPILIWPDLLPWKKFIITIRIFCQEIRTHVWIRLFMYTTIKVSSTFLNISNRN